MNTILFCWIASLSAISAGLLLGLLTKVYPDNHFCSRHRKELKLMTSFAFLIALISGYLGSAENIWFGIFGTIGAFVPIWLGYAIGSRSLLFRLNKEYNTINCIVNIAAIVIFAAILIFWKIKIGSITPAVYLLAAIASASITMACTILITATLLIGYGLLQVFSYLCECYRLWLND